jgi:NAD+ synthase
MSSAGSGMSVPANRTERGEFLPLAINPALVERILVGFIQDEVRKVGFQRVVIGLSGGVDSSLAATLAARALGPSNVKGLLMPYRLSDPRSQRDAEAVVRQLGIEHELIDISPQIDAYFARYPDAEPARRGNKMARERMTILYDHSWGWQALVLGTSNKTELLLGYGTIYGDMASAVNPIGDLYKTQVWQLADALGVPTAIVQKAPSADLWAGQTDEVEMGFQYREVDRLLYYLIERRYAVAELEREGFGRAFIDVVMGKVRDSQYKRRLPVIAKLSSRTIDRDFRYPRDWGR